MALSTNCIWTWAMIFLVQLNLWVKVYFFDIIILPLKYEATAYHLKSMHRQNRDRWPSSSSNLKQIVFALEEFYFSQYFYGHRNSFGRFFTSNLIFYQNLHFSCVFRKLSWNSCEFLISTICNPIGTFAWLWTGPTVRTKLGTAVCLARFIILCWN